MTGTWGFWGHIQAVRWWRGSCSPPSPLRASRESKPQRCWCVRACCVSLGWLSSEKGPSCPKRASGPQPQAEIRVPAGNPAGTGCTSHALVKWPCYGDTQRGEKGIFLLPWMRAHTHTSPGLFPRPGGLLGCLEYRAVFDAVLVDADKVQGLCVTGGGAGHQALQPFTHEPLVCLGCHFAGHVLLGPFVHPGLESLV